MEIARVRFGFSLLVLTVVVSATTLTQGKVYATTAAPAPVQQAWMAHYNGPANDYDNPSALVVDHQGNVYVTGFSCTLQSGGGCVNYDYATLKYDPTGKRLWARRYNGPGNYNDLAAALAVDWRGNIYVTGSSLNSATGDDFSDYATLKYDPTGKLLWARRYSGPGKGGDGANDLAVDGQGNVYVTGASEGDYATLKYDTNGKLLWVQRYNGPGNSSDEARAVAVDGRGNVYVTGSSGLDYATLKYDTRGKLLWVQRYGVPESYQYHDPRDLAVDRWGNVYVTGVANQGLFGDYATVKYNTHGKLLWAQRYDGPAQGTDEAVALAVDERGNVYVTGVICTEMYVGEEDAQCLALNDSATLKYDPNGKLLWMRRYNALGGLYATALAVDKGGSVYVGGGRILKHDTHGTLLWEQASIDWINVLTVDGGGTIYVTGRGGDSGTGEDYVTVKYTQGHGQPNPK